MIASSPGGEFSIRTEIVYHGCASREDEDMKAELVSESITPVSGTTDTGGMARGEPGLPRRFTWRDDDYDVAEVIEVWKESGPCRSGGAEKYLRKHWFKVKTTCGREMTLYFERQPRSKPQSKRRWWLYTATAPSA